MTMHANVDPLTEDDKIAITGIGCRYGDGVAGPQEIWKMLKEGRDCTTPHPQERFDKSTYLYPGNKKRGKVYTKAGGYLKQDPLMFDRQFFKMSPDEAEHMDPQIRILLEVVWESIADAGIPASTLRGSNTGVYMGVTANEYFVLTGLPQSNIGQYTNSGTNSCMISNRISYEFDLRGPSFTIDTACSSSLYAVQVACDALRGGACDTAIAGGVNIILTPSVTIGFCQAGMLSPDGQCRSFDESANGYSRSEGVGSVVLKPLKTAIADGDRIYAVIRGGALTNDGRTPGIANPSFDAQIDLVHRACAAAKVDPRDVAYIEAHGTGTPVGDKTEANAIGEAMSKQRSDDRPPLYIGSIKSNVGHAEGAAGIAGVIKTALSLYFREIPGVVHFKRGNPNIDFQNLKLRVPSSIIPWPEESMLLAGCSSFGFGGANAHIVLEASPSRQFTNHTDDDSSSTSETYNNMLILSAKSSNALQQSFVDWKNFLSDSNCSNSGVFQNVLYTANTRSHKHAQRAVFISKSKEELLTLLQKRINGESSNVVIEGKAPEGNATIRTVFVFSGMGTQWWGMARELMHTQPIFNKVLQSIDDHLLKYGAKWSLIHMLSEETDINKINEDTEISQTCICSVQIGLVELYKRFGVTPSAIIGHSVGEVAAAYAAGLLNMAEAVKIIFKRGNLLRKTTGSGTMAAVLHDVEDVKTRMKSTATYIDIAAINSPKQIVLSGKTDYIHEFTAKLKEDGIQTKVLKVNNAFHSREQEILKVEFFKNMKFLKKKKSTNKQRPLIPMMSTVTNRYLTLQEANDPAYWWSNIRRQVKFNDAVEATLKDGYNSFVEIGAHPALSPAINDIIASGSNAPTVYFVTHSLKRPRDLKSSPNDILNFNMSLAQMCINGYPIDMKPVFQGHNCQVVSLPLYPWQRNECSAATTAANALWRYPNNFHPLLGKPDSSVNYYQNTGLCVWKAKVGTHKEPWIADHVVQGSVVLPAAGFIETAIAAHHNLFSSAEDVFITDLHFDRFMFVSEDDTTVETTTEMEPDGTATFKFCSFNERGNKWTKHSTMNLNPNGKRAEKMFLPVDDIINGCSEQLDKASFYANMKEIGFNLGESFLCIEKAHYNPVVDEALIDFRAPKTVAAQSSRFHAHPALLDGILQSIAGIQRMRNKHTKGRVPRSIEQIYFKKCAFPDNMYLHAIIMSDGKDMCGDIYIGDAETSEVIGKFSKIRFGPVDGRSEENRLNLLEKKWVPIEMGEKTLNPTGLTLIAGDDQELSFQLNKILTSMGINSKVEIWESNQLDQSDTEDEPLPNVDTDDESLSNVIITIKPGDKDNIDNLLEEDFFQQQSQIAEMCINQYKAISSMEGINPNIWLVTRDGFCVTNDDTVDPYQASAYGFGVCLMQEDIHLKLFIVDLQSYIDSKTAADWLLKYIWGSDSDEKIIALRNYTSRPHTDFSVYSFRVSIHESRNFPYQRLSQNWKFDVGKSFQSGRMALVTDRANDEVRLSRNKDYANVKDKHALVTELAKEETLPLVTCRYHANDEGRSAHANDEGSLTQNKSTEFTSVDIESFRVLQPKSESEEIHPVVLFCGHSEQSSLVMGVCSSTEFKSSLRCSDDELIKIDSKLSAAQVINIVTSYFVPFMVVRDLKPDGTTVVCMSSREDKQSLAVAHMAVELGHNVVVATKDISVKHGIHLSSGDSMSIVDGKCIMSGLNGHGVGCVIGGETYVTEILKCTGGLKKKLKPFATIEMLNSNKGLSRTDNLGLPVNARVVIKNYEFPLLGGFQQIQPFVNMLLTIFEKPSSMHPVQDVIPRILLLTELESQDNIAFNNVTFLVDKEVVPVDYDFSGGMINFSAQESYIVTGGTKGFGLCLVEWLVNNGAGCVTILSRSAPDAEAEERLENLRKRGASIVHIKTDITNRSDVELAFETIIADSSKSLSGIFHCAAQYDDKLIKDITRASWKSVLATKSWGALLLHQTSVKFNVPLKYFVMISSVVQMIGNSGQASYCAANTYLSSLGQFRRLKGLPATVFCPGVIGDTGFAARKGLVGLWERKGIDSLTALQVLNGLGVMLVCRVDEIGIIGYIRFNDFIMGHRGLIKEYPSIDGAGLMMGFCSAIEDESDRFHNHTKPDESKRLIFQTLCGFISKRLGLSSDISPDSSPSSLGVDSLMSTELSGDIQRKFHVPFSPMEFMNTNVTLHALSVSIYKKILSKYKPGAKVNDEEDKEDTSWKAWYIMDENIISPAIQLICFPPNGSGPSVYAWWQDKLSRHKVQLIMAQLPGWEGRHLEEPLQNLEVIVSTLTEHLAPRLLPGRFVLFGHSIGGLIAFEVGHRLKTMDLQPAHMIISSWFAPTLDYPNATELAKGPSILRQMEQDIKNNIQLTDNKTMKLSFVDDDVLGNAELMRRLIPCFHAGFKICQNYSSTHKMKLQCGMTVFGGKSDRFVPPALLDAWNIEIEPGQRFKKILFSGGHMHITSARKKVFREIEITLRDAFNV